MLARRPQGHPPRPLGAVVRHNAWRLRRRPMEVVPFHELKIDERFHSTGHDGDAIRAWLAAAKCHIALLYGERSHMGAAALRSGDDAPGRCAREAGALRDVAASGDAASVQLLPLPAGHYVLEDAPLALRDALAATLARWAASGAMDATGPRAPETLGLRPLQTYASIEEAARALCPRAVPTRHAVEAALAALDVEGSGGAEEEQEEGAHRQTALARNGREYFGFVG
jgi:hypothetical protein